MLSLLSPWGAAAGAAVGSAVATAAEQLAGPLAFANVLRSDPADSVSPGEHQADPLPSLREQLATQQSALQSKIAARLREAGISLEQPLALEADPFGDLRVAGGHRAAGQIELLVNGDETIQAELADLQALGSEIDRLEILQRAERLHDLDPRAASDLRRLARQHEAQLPRLLIGGLD